MSISNDVIISLTIFSSLLTVYIVYFDVDLIVGGCFPPSNAYTTALLSSSSTVARSFVSSNKARLLLPAFSFILSIILSTSSPFTL